MFRRFTPLLTAVQGAGASESAAAAMLAEIDEGRLDATTIYARAATATGQLAVSEAECRDVLLATIDCGLSYRFVTERGWTDDRFASWLGQLRTSRLAEPNGRPADT